MRVVSFCGFLVFVAFLLLALMALGAATRLTDSGLSMTTWQPLGELPPLDLQAWQQTFRHYQQSPEGQSVNRGISLEEFQRIYWWEWAHRSLARGIALLLLGLLLLQVLLKNRDRALFLCSLLVLVALQGFLGWGMVKSGLREVARVSPYFLAAHLLLALLLLLAVMRRLFHEQFWQPRIFVSRPVRVAVFSVALLSGLTFLMGGFVAGLKAGLLHNDWPLMSSSFIPSDYALLHPWWRNALENPSAVQFEHRFLALLLLLGCVGLFWKFWRSRVRLDGHVRLLLFLPLLQVFLGGLVLRLHVPVFLGVVHHILGVCLVVSLFVLSWRLESDGG